ncbi:MAG: nucleotide sugar dehydrogenase [Planctomycetes bacterium]|nr:nucleotide sugar dehydrogenase [Planctomycetota bacterium]
MARLLARIDSREALVGVVGLGYIGLPVAGAMLDAGFSVLGYDVDAEKIAALAAGRVYLHHLGEDWAARRLATGRFAVTSDAGRLGEPDALLLCVPTPLLADREPDLSYVRTTADDVARVLRPGQLVVLESTTYPGTTRDVLRPALEASGLSCARDVFVAYAPEREDPGAGRAVSSVPRVVGGLDDAAREAAVRLYGAAVAHVVPVSSVEVAEAAKLLENVYRAVNIALVNELKVLLTALGVDVHEVIDAAATKPFGFAAFRPGPGLGGHCIPIDPFYLAHVARAAGVPARFVELAGEVNSAMPEWIVGRVRTTLAARGVAIDAARILVIGLAYKADVDDTRESPSFVLVERLLALGAHVDYHDPHVPRSRPVRHAQVPPMESVALDATRLATYDAVLVSTDHAAVDWDLVARHARLVFDSRGVLRGFRNVIQV